MSAAGKPASGPQAGWAYLILALMAGALVLAGVLRSPDAAQAAPCSFPSYVIANGKLTIAGTSCAEDPEDFIVRCEGGTIRFFYAANNNGGTQILTSYACSAPTSIWVYGNEGNDRIDLTQVFAAAGFTSIGAPGTRLDGGPGDDKLFGSPFSDVIADAGDGDDILRGYAGRDFLFAGDGSDDLYGDGGKDRLFGQGGRDGLFGGKGKDFLKGGALTDLLNGGPGTDRCRSDKLDAVRSC